MKPTADAGTDQTKHVSALVQVDGRASSDPNSLPLTFSWSQVSGPSTLTFSSTTSSHPTFMLGPIGGTYVVQLIVSNGTQSSDPALTSIIAQDPVIQLWTGSELIDAPLKLWTGSQLI